MFYVVYFEVLFVMRNKLDINRPFMYELVPVVGEIMDDFYPEVKENREFIEKVIKNEEERFHETLHEGLAILFDVIKKKRKKGAAKFKVVMFSVYMTLTVSLLN